MTTAYNLELFASILQNYKILEIIKSTQKLGWTHVWQEFDKVINDSTFKNDEEKNIFIDLFFTQCLKVIAIPQTAPILWDIIQKWLNHRNLQHRNGALDQNEKITLVHFCVNLRKKLQEYFTHVQLEELTLTEEHQYVMISIWKQLFFESFSPINLYWNPTQDINDFTIQLPTNEYNKLIIASMYEPFSADNYHIHSEKIISSSIPGCCKKIIIYWMLNTPYFHGEEHHRKKLLTYLPKICSALINHPSNLSIAFFLNFVQEAMTGLWRTSYIGGNNIEALSIFGDFITKAMSRFVIYPKPNLIFKNIKKGEKIRIGYISRNFYKQAVSCYMVNRIIHHNKDNFEIYVFALGEHHDEISELFEKNSHHFERITDLNNIGNIVKSVLEHKLDILIYADIGMDPVTYVLSGLKLAPVQCAMVGHGTSTGMPNIQYYLSGDFEAPDAEYQYQEKLVRLPNLGAAQYLPITPEEKLTRKDLDIPDDAVIFVSCANGIKHGSSRDAVFIDILKEAANAWILLKPFSSHVSIDYKYTNRLMEKAKIAGVADRLMILPPIACTKHVLGLLAISDVQLDSFPYGGWTTNMEALYMGLPIVTQEGNLSRSRWGAGMLRALGITEGIAANEKEYVDWAVKLAQNRELRQQLKTKIKSKVKDALFNGAAAQPAFEDTLIQIYQDECNKTLEPNQISTYSQPQSWSNSTKEAITIATSIKPHDLDNQRKAIQSWQDAGFKVVSINPIDEIAMLYSKITNIEFIAAPRDARDKYGKPYIYFDDILTYFDNRDSTICGIMNPDLHLLKDFKGSIHNFLQQEASNSLAYGYRLDVESLTSQTGQIYTAGFDYIFFDKKYIKNYPKQEFCLGLPWWDYWAVLVPLMHKSSVKRLITPIALHLKHSPDYNLDTWSSLGTMLSDHLHPPFDISNETLPKYVQETAQIINTLSLNISLPDFK